MASILMVITSSPHTPAGERAPSRSASPWPARDTRSPFAASRTAVLLASTRAPSGGRAALDRLLDPDARCLVLSDDLILRGLQAAARARAIDYPAVVATLTADHDRVVGAL